MYWFSITLVVVRLVNSYSIYIYTNEKTSFIVITSSSFVHALNWKKTIIEHVLFCMRLFVCRPEPHFFLSFIWWMWWKGKETKKNRILWLLQLSTQFNKINRQNSKSTFTSFLASFWLSPIYRFFFFFSTSS